MNTHVMIDIETLGKTPGCAILSIGAVEFNPMTAELGENFYLEIDTNSCLQTGLLIDLETKVWWDKQNDDAKALLYRCAGTHCAKLHDALQCLEDWLLSLVNDNPKKLKVWANSPSFDLDILSHAYTASLDKAAPWLFFNELDCRTVVDIGRTFGADPKKTIPFDGTAHHALHDARHQARYVSAVYQHIHNLQGATSC